MRHQVAGKQLNRSSNHRKALFRNLVRSLVKSGQIETTEAKAKVLSRWFDKLVTKAKDNTLHSRRQVLAVLGDTSLTNRLVDQMVPQMSSRVSGYTKSVKLGTRRGDAATVVRVSLTDPVTLERATPEPAKKAAAAKKPTKKESA